MEIHLNELIDKIKKDGVEVAENEAKAIVENAKAEAEKIVAEAEEKAKEIIEKAKAENAKNQRSSEEAITQAGRNLLISFRQSVTRELGAILSDEVNAVYSSDALAEIIANVVEAMAKNLDTEKLEVVLNSSVLEKFEKTVLSALKARMLKGVTLKANDNFDGGFRIAVNDGSAYYDYSAESVVKMLSGYLSPKVAELLKKAE